jgi:alkylation response protein AidB-like acyl-CoA dehydrogenase
MASTLSGAIAEFGSPEQRAYFLPSLARGETRCHLGYSEPDVGSDLASLSTRARRDGDDWIVDGTKMWGTGANVADYVWLATRTDPDVPKHRGITMFLAPTRLPGWSLVEHRALSGEIACTTVFDGVRIPDSCRVGEVDGGWSVITSALVAERVVMAGLVGEMTRQVTDLLSALRAAPSLAPAGSAARVTVNDLVVRLQAARSLLGASARAAADGTGGWLEAPMAKVVTGDLGERLAAAALEILGPDAAFGDTDHALRLAPMYVIGGGTADIQRNLIARAIGLPRS